MELPWDDISILWHAAVYVRVGVDRECLRDEYLKYIGGQNKVYCQTYNLPLTVLDQNLVERLMCSRRVNMEAEVVMNKCSITAVLCCAVTGCGACICRKHRDSDRNSAGKVYVCAATPPIVQDTERDDDDLVSRRNNRIASQEGKHNDNGNDDYNNDDEQSRYLAGVEWDKYGDGVVEDTGDDVSHHGFVADDGLLDTGMFVTNAMLLDDSVVEEVVHESFDFVSMNAGVQAIPIWDVRASEGMGRSYITSHVVLNSCGSCLIRRKGELRANKHQAAFWNE
jgi:hypothetical protein